MGDTEDERHRREEADRRARRKAAKASKSESQLEKDRKRKEHAARVLREANQGKRPKPPTPGKGGGKGGDESSVFASLFTKRAEGFHVDLNFRNAAPRPPVGPIFVGPGLEGELMDKWTRYKPFNAVESNYSWRLHSEPDLGVPLAPSAMDLEGCYVDPSKRQKKSHDEDDDDDDEAAARGPATPPPLHPDDAALLNWTGSMGDTAAEELQRRRDRARAAAHLAAGEGGTRATPGSAAAEIRLKRAADGEVGKKKGFNFKSRVLNESTQFWMKKTTYLANDQTKAVHKFTSLAETNKKTADEVEEKLKKSTQKMSDGDAIDAAFTRWNNDASGRPPPTLRHPTKQDVRPVFDCPLLPDVSTWGHTYTHVVLDNPPRSIHGVAPSTPAQLDRAFVADVDRDSGRTECHLLVPSDVAKSSSGETTLYDVSQRYDLDVFPLKDDGPHVNFVIMVDEDNEVVTYHPINSRVQLSTGRQKGPNARGTIVERRAMGEEDVREMEMRVAEVDDDLARKYKTFMHENGDEEYNEKGRYDSDVDKGEEGGGSFIAESSNRNNNSLGGGDEYDRTF